MTVVTAQLKTIRTYNAELRKIKNSKSLELQLRMYVPCSWVKDALDYYEATFY